MSKFIKAFESDLKALTRFLVGTVRTKKNAPTKKKKQLKRNGKNKLRNAITNIVRQKIVPVILANVQKINVAIVNNASC